MDEQRWLGVQPEDLELQAGSRICNVGGHGDSLDFILSVTEGSGER